MVIEWRPNKRGGKTYRVNSANPRHRALVARQKAARRKRVKAGKINTHFVTKSGKIMANPSRRTAANLVEITYPSGRKVVVTARDAMRLITSRTIRPQRIGPVRSR